MSDTETRRANRAQARLSRRIITAATDLIDAMSGDVERARRLWTDAFEEAERIDHNEDADADEIGNPPEPQYIGMGIVPTSVASDCVLAHNQVMHTAHTPCGVRGFRAWTWAKDDVPPHFTECNCGWSGLPHVSAAEFQRKLRTA